MSASYNVTGGVVTSAIVHALCPSRAGKFATEWFAAQL